MRATDEPMIDVWVTKYALTSGIKKMQVRICEGIDENMVATIGSFSLPAQHFHVEGRDWHRTHEGAIAKAEEMRLKKIATLQRQIGKLNKMNFRKEKADE